MAKFARVVRKALKVILYGVIGVVVLFLLLTLLVQIPLIQNKIVQKATSYVESKTRTRVEIDHVRIFFPNAVVVTGVYLEDKNTDTLLYAGKLKVSVVLRDLLKDKIHIKHLELQDAVLNLHSTEADSLFNYQFLVTAFSDTTSTPDSKPSDATAWVVSINRLTLKRVSVKYDDVYAGMYAAVDLGYLKLTHGQLDLAHSLYTIDKLDVSGLKANVLLSKLSADDDESSGERLPKITAKVINIRNSGVVFVDSTQDLAVSAIIRQLGLRVASVDLEQQTVLAKKIELSESKVRYVSTSLEQVEEPLRAETTESSGTDQWTVSVDGIRLTDNDIEYTISNKKRTPGSFDANHMRYKHLNLFATNFHYSPLKTEVSVKGFSTIDQNGYVVKSFKTDFKMDPNSITAKGLMLTTPLSSINADVSIRFPSLATLQDSLELMSLNLVMNYIRVTTSDLAYFSTALADLPFFDQPSNVTAISGRLSGTLNHLNGKKIKVKTGKQTTLYANFTITGLPDMQIAHFAFPDAHITTGKRDLELFAGSFLPDQLAMPELLDLKAVFNGRVNAFATRVNLTSSFGSVELLAALDDPEVFDASAKMDRFDLGRLLKDTVMFGPVSMTARANGKGFSPETIRTSIKADVSQIYLNRYNYQHLTVDGTIAGKQFAGDVALRDPNALLDFSGVVNLNPNQERTQFQLNLKGANLKKLHLATEDIRLGFLISADVYGAMDRVNAVKGRASVSDFVLAKDGEVYRFDSIMSVSFNQPGKRRTEKSEPLVEVECSGSFSLATLGDEVSQLLQYYFSTADSSAREMVRTDHSDIAFFIQLHNHPVLYKMLIPALEEMGPGTISGSYKGVDRALVLDVEMQKITYDASEINDLVVKVHSDSAALHYKVSSSAIANGQVVLENLLLDGSVANQRIDLRLSSEDALKRKKIALKASVSDSMGRYTLVFDPDEFYLLNKRWAMAPDHVIEFGREGFRIHQFWMKHADSELKINSVHHLFNDDIDISITQFDLADISQVLEGDSGIVKGMVNGHLLLKRVGASYGLVADATIRDLIYHHTPIGDLAILANNPANERFEVEVQLSGPDNAMRAVGYYDPEGGPRSLNVDVSIQSLSMKTVEAFSMGYISEAEGYLTGDLLLTGSVKDPVVEGEIVFNETFINPSVLNNRLELKHETIVLKEDGIYFRKFTLRDALQHTAILDGSVQMKNFDDFIFALQVTTNQFLLINTTAKDHQNYYGRMIIDSRIDVKGTMALPVITGNVKLVEGSAFTVVVPEGEVHADKGAGVVVFEDTVTRDNLLYAFDPQSQTDHASTFSGFDLSVIVEIDREATLKLLMDPTSKDSLVVRGDAALSFSIDRSGKMSLTGGYTLDGGSYQVSLQSMVKRNFDIIPGSTIIWSGDPLNAEINIRAKYEVRAAPYDLVATQITSMSAAEQGSYKQRYPFWVIIHLKGEILQPVISFEIQLPPEEKGILGGAMNQKLVMLNGDESALNKQVFALLIMGRFIQENPLQTSSGGTSMLVRTTVGNYISSQLNRLSAKALPGTVLNFDVQSYDDYQTGEARGRTQVELGVKKQLFKERLSIQVGGAVDVEGDKASENTASEITSDVTVEYKLTKDGRYLLRGFRHNQYDGFIEGQLVETGVGFVYVLEFNRWYEVFRAPQKNKDAYIKEDQNDTIQHP